VLARIAQGEAAATRECIDQYGNLVWSIARRLLRSHGDAQDAVGEIFNEVWRSAARFDPTQGSERVFVTTIARRRLIDRMRRAAHQAPSESMGIHSLSWVNGAHSAEASAEGRAAGRAVKQLRPELQKVLELGVLQGMSHAEIAKVLQLPVGTVKSMMYRGLIQVRELMGGR
jgi:RNA polymerase sigma-70 factor (ECF subfamily)